MVSFVYLAVLLWCFMGVSVIADVFMEVRSRVISWHVHESALHNLYAGPVAPCALHRLRHSADRGVDLSLHELTFQAIIVITSKTKMVYVKDTSGEVETQRFIKVSVLLQCNLRGTSARSLLAITRHAIKFVWPCDKTDCSPLRSGIPQLRTSR